MTEAPDLSSENQLPSPPKPLRPMTPAFFVAIGFGVLCLVAALFVGVLGPRVWPKKPVASAHSVAAATTAPAPPPSAVQLQARIAELEQELQAARAGVASSPPAASEALSARLDRLEAAQRRAGRAAAAAVAAGALA